ncbi:TonB-dependent siderophore receptor [Martelella mangrovi]|uniref:Iron complex outermembrane receptor protein n=1 Tax=Martelella mangrovi TaxID=1397477 RepID=A0ABV2ICW4_9HYPH
MRDCKRNVSARFGVRLLVSTVSLIAMSAGGQALAQQATQEKDTTVLDPVTVTTTGGAEGYVAYDTTTGSKTGTPIAETPQSVNAVTAEEMKDRAVSTTTEAIEYSPGVFASTSAISQRFDYFSIRGFDATNSGIMLDGLNSTTVQSYVRYQPYGMEEIDVLSGPSSVLYGAGSLGGVVNAISKKPLDEPYHEIGIQAGSHDRLEARFDFSGPMNEDGTLLYRLVGLGRLADTQFDYVPDDTGYFAPSFTWQPNADTSLTVLGSYSRDEFGPPRPFLPIQGTLLPNPNGPIPWNTYLDGSDLDNHNEQFNLGYDFDHAFNDVWSFHSAGRYTRNDLFTQTLSGMGLESDMRTLNRTAYEFSIVGDIFALDNNAKAEWQAGPWEGTNVFGVAYRNTAEDYWLNYGPADPVDIYNPTYNGQFSAPTPVTSTDQTSDGLGLYSANTFIYDDMFAIDLAGRQDWNWVKTDNRLNGTSSKQDDDAFTYRAGLTYLSDWNVNPYVSYATSFDPQLGTDFYGNTFKPTTGKQIEVGAKYEPDAFEGLFTVAYYHLVQENVKTPDPDNDLNTIQTGEVTANGIELSASANVTPNFEFLASYSYNHQEITSTTNPLAAGKRPTGVPEHMASLWMNYTFDYGALNGLSLGAGVRYVGETYADTANTITVPDFALVDAALSYDFGARNPDLEGLNLAVNASNLFDKHYYSGCSARSCSQGFDRMVKATLTYNW